MHAFRIDAVGGFVHDEHIGVLDEDVRDTQALLHALRIGARPAVHGLGHAHAGDQLVDARLQIVAGEAVHRAGHAQVLPARHIGIKAHIIRQIAHKALDLYGVSGAVHAGDGGASGGGLGQAQQHQRGGGLACTVGSQQAEHLALPHGQVQVVHRGQCPVALRQRLGFNDRASHAQRLPYFRMTRIITTASTTMMPMPVRPHLVSVLTVMRNSALSLASLLLAVRVVT